MHEAQINAPRAERYPRYKLGCDKPKGCIAAAGKPSLGQVVLQRQHEMWHEAAREFDRILRRQVRPLRTLKGAQFRMRLEVDRWHSGLTYQTIPGHSGICRWRFGRRP